MRTFWCLYREAPLRVLFESPHGFAEPRQDESRPLRAFDTEADANFLRKQLKERTFVAKRSYLRQRMKNDHRVDS